MWSGTQNYIQFKIMWNKEIMIYQCFMETCIGDLAKESTNKDYQENNKRFNME